ncbi:DNA sulfur modification protein DndB [Streptomyces chartreusis]|uniref:DNA sulfur modification protein DndB n=1 Tax=Streptomyces chartreusis TaxID=1969 RepID=UPI002F917F68
MGRPEGQISPTAGPELAALAVWLRAQRQRAGLTYQQMAQRTGYAHSTLSRAAGGSRIPRLRVAEAYARACRADLAEVRRLWRRARQSCVQAFPGGMPIAGVRPEYVSDFAGLHAAMITLRRSIGVPSLRELTRRAGEHGELPHSTLHRVVSQQAIPSRRHVVAFVKACGVSGTAVQEWTAAWDRASGLRTEQATALAFRAASPRWAASAGGPYGVDGLAAVTRLLATGSATFKGFVEMERSVLGARSSKLFTLSALYYGNQNLLAGIDADAGRQLQLADAYWSAVDSVIPEWEMVRHRVLHASEVHRTYVHCHGIALHCLGSVGNLLLRRTENPRKWTSYLQRLQSVDWARSNPAWEGRALVGGRVAKSLHNAALTTEHLLQQMRLPHNGAVQHNRTVSSGPPGRPL